MGYASGKSKKRAKGEAKAQDRWAKADKVPKVEELKEVSMVKGVPLCVYGFSAEDFQTYRRAWQGYAEGTYPLGGMCFRNNAYEAVVVPTQANQAAALNGLSAAQVTTVFAYIVKRHLKREDRKEEERRVMHGKLLSTLSERSIAIIHARDATLIPGRDPLLLWRSVLATHQAGNHFMSELQRVEHAQKAYFRL
jgi:hypothetical protein